MLFHCWSDISFCFSQFKKNFFNAFPLLKRHQFLFLFI